MERIIQQLALDMAKKILTELGPINIHRDCYYNKNTGHCETTLDKMIGNLHS